MANESSFHDLIRRIRDRDETAAAELVAKYEAAIRRVVRIHLRDVRLRRVLDSMDVCQSVLASFFVRAALGQYELDSPDQLLGLLATIGQVISAVLSGKPDQAERLARNGALAAAAKLAARARVRGTR